MKLDIAIEKSKGRWVIVALRRKKGCLLIGENLYEGKQFFKTKSKALDKALSWAQEQVVDGYAKAAFVHFGSGHDYRSWSFVAGVRGCDS